jgi:hypothetical protein
VLRQRGQSLPPKGRLLVPGEEDPKPGMWSVGLNLERTSGRRTTARGLPGRLYRRGRSFEERSLLSSGWNSNRRWLGRTSYSSRGVQYCTVPNRSSIGHQGEFFATGSECLEKWSGWTNCNYYPGNQLLQSLAHSAWRTYSKARPEFALRCGACCGKLKTH